MTLPSPITIVRQIVQAVPLVLERLSDETVQAIKAAGYDGIRTVMSGGIFGSVFGYLSGGSFADAVQRMATVVSRAYVETAELAYQEGGGELPLDDETAAWARSQLDIQLAYVDDLFLRLKDLRKEGGFDAGEEAQARAAGYANSLDSFFGEAKMRGSDNITLEFGGTDGKESCKDCQKMMGKRHRIKYILAHNLVPKPGNDTFECKGYECHHFWFNPKTGERFDG
jgi:hypothetical protein